MKFVFGPIPRNQEFDSEDGGWARLPDPTTKGFALQALFLTVVFLVPVAALFPNLIGYPQAFPAPFYALIFFIVVMIPAHELIHAICYPGGLFSGHVVMGTWFRRGLFYVVYDLPVSRIRILLMLIAPFLILSVPPAAVAITAPPEWRLIAVLCFLIHGSICASDFAAIARVIRFVPKGSLVRNDGWVTSWKPV